MRVVAIGSRAFVAGMKLAGLEGMPVDDKDKAFEVVREMVERQDVGLILLSSKLGREIRVRIGEIRKKHPLPLIYELPEPGEGFEEVEYRKLIKQILGF